MSSLSQDGLLVAVLIIVFYYASLMNAVVDVVLKDLLP